VEVKAAVVTAKRTKGLCVFHVFYLTFYTYKINLQHQSAASLTIGVGSFEDPEDIPGLAHFLEHMVFMGSDKFPQENDFDAFIKVC
jgi:predicted Zn-dependent peptidase